MTQTITDEVPATTRAELRTAWKSSVETLEAINRSMQEPHEDADMPALTAEFDAASAAVDLARTAYERHGKVAIPVGLAGDTRRGLLALLADAAAELVLASYACKPGRGEALRTQLDGAKAALDEMGWDGRDPLVDRTPALSVAVTDQLARAESDLAILQDSGHVRAEAVAVGHERAPYERVAALAALLAEVAA